MARWLAAKAGLNPKTDIQIVAVGSPLALQAALRNKDQTDNHDSVALLPIEHVVSLALWQNARNNPPRHRLNVFRQTMAFCVWMLWDAVVVCRIDQPGCWTAPEQLDPEAGRREARAWARRIAAAELDFADSDEANVAFAQAIVRCAAAKPNSLAKTGDVRAWGRAVRKR